MSHSTDSVRAYHHQDLLDYLTRHFFSAVTERPSRSEQTAVICVDSLLAEVHFPENTRADWIAHKALAVNLSDLAAMGAMPKAIVLGIILPQWDWPWLQQFCSGFRNLASRWQLELSAIDVRPGPLSVTIQAQGETSQPDSMRRANARIGDQIYVTGSLGAAACALHYHINQQPLPSRYQSLLEQRLNVPEPRVEAGLALASLAHACIDISDGLIADLGHILQESHVGARLQLENIPVSIALKELMDPQQQTRLSLMGGDDYELCFTIAADNIERMQSTMADLSLPCHHIGEITAGGELEYYSENQKILLNLTGYDHFAQTSPSL